MAAASKQPTVPKWVIDLHGIKDVLTTSSNSVRTSVIDAIISGEALVLRSVQTELNAAYPMLWRQFTAIKSKKYIDVSGQAYGIATHYQEAHGSSLLGGIPDFAMFEALAVAKLAKCKLVSAAKGLSDCQSIARKCGLPPDLVVGTSAVQ